MSNVTKLPTSAKSYLTVHKNGDWWDVVLVTPGPARSIKTRLHSVQDRRAACEYGRDMAARMQRPFKARGGAA